MGFQTHAFNKTISLNLLVTFILSTLYETLMSILDYFFPEKIRNKYIFMLHKLKV